MLHILTRKEFQPESKISVVFSNVGHYICCISESYTTCLDDEKTDSLKPLRPHYISVAPGPMPTDTGRRPSPSGHIIATLETIPLSHPSSNSKIATDTADSPGRDVLAWGLNQHYQLGNGKRASASSPVTIDTADREGRLMCKVGQGKVRDFNETVVGRRMKIEQRAVAGPGLSVIYWRIV